MVRHKKKVLAVFGAGATQSFIPELNTESITEHVLAVTNWEDVINKIKRIESTLDIDVKPACKFLSIIKELKNSQKREINFEDVVYLCDQLFSNALSALQPVNPEIFYSVDNLLFRCFAKFCDSTKQMSALPHGGYYPYILREVIADCVLKHWNKYKQGRDYNNGVDIVKCFIEKLNKVFKSSVSLYSLNYDPLLYEANKAASPPLRTGFETTDRQFFPEDFYKSDKTLAFMHGHVWFRGNNNKYPELVFNENYEDGYQRVLFKASFSNEQIYNAFLVSGRHTSKIDSGLLQPYTTYMSKYVKDIAEASHILLIGVSLSDYHLFLHLNRRLFPDQKIIVVNFDGEQITGKMTGEKLQSILEKLYRHDQPLWTFVFNGEYGESDNELNKYPAERCIRLKDNILFYHRGTKQYFEKINSDRGWKKLLLLE